MSKNPVDSISPIISPVSGTMYTTGITSAAPAYSPTDTTATLSATKHVTWGSGDDYPNVALEQARKNNIIPTAVAKKAAAIYGSGINFGKVDMGDDDRLIRKSLYAERPEIRNWLNAMNVTLYREMFAKEFAWLENVFVQGIFSFDRKIARLMVIPGRKCRLAKPDDNGLVKTCLIAADFATRATNPLELPLIDITYDPLGQLKSIKGNRFMMHIKSHSPDMEHYGLPMWDSAIRSNLLAYQDKVIKFKNAFIDNQLKVSNILYIADWYLQWKYSDWDQKPDLQQARFKELVDSIESKLTNIDKSGVALSAITKEIFVKDKSETRDPFRIVPVDRPKLTEMLNQDLAEINVNLFIAAGIDATLVMSTSNNMGGGSGSNKRVAQNNMALDVTSAIDLMLMPLNIAMQHNFDPDIECWVAQPYISTLDTGKQVTNNPPTNG